MNTVASIRDRLLKGQVIPALPLALNAQRKLDERRQRALLRYYLAAGAGGIAVGVHTTQFAIRLPEHSLFEPLLELAAEEMARRPEVLRIGGICGSTQQALTEARALRDNNYDCGLLSLAALSHADDSTLLAHCRQVSEIIPIVGFYLQPAVGGRLLSYQFWRQLMELPFLVAIKVAPFNRYQTLDVVRAVAQSGRDDVALYTGNDDNIIVDLVTEYRFANGPQVKSVRFCGGLLGQWAVWTKRAVELLFECHQVQASRGVLSPLLTINAQLVDANAALFDAANNYHGCIAGIHEVLRRQGLLEGIWCLDPRETLSPGQAEQIDRVYSAYPELNDDLFVREHLDQWLSG